MKQTTLKPWPDGWRILCTRPDNLGDVLMTTPAFRALKESFPNCQLTLLTSSAGAAIARLIPYIDDIIIFDVPWVKSDSQAPEPSSLVAIVDQLRQRQFDAAIVFTVQSQNPLPMAMLCYLAQIPRVLGYCRENPYHLLTDWVPDPEVLVATRHEVVRQLDLVRAIGATTNQKKLSICLPSGARETSQQVLTELGVDLNKPWILLHAGVSEEKRRYPAEKFTEVSRQLIHDEDVQIILTGSRSEWAYSEQIRQWIGKGAYNLAGRLALPEFCGLIANAPLLVSNNTGPVHIAAAVGTPVVVVYAKTNPQHIPWMVPNQVLYVDVPKHLRSRNVLLQRFPKHAEPDATPERIVAAIKKLLNPVANVVTSDTITESGTITH
ncbi:lipopolysaccharide heptosyltransferase II [Spirosoma sp.]|uniref:lipopolysaccharide heptosyltransferase II n=1 Tax=Spirosoma sp. TaxID=1899569 RepID=UPI003B3A2A31